MIFSILLIKKIKILLCCCTNIFKHVLAFRRHSTCPVPDMKNRKTSSPVFVVLKGFKVIIGVAGLIGTVAWLGIHWFGVKKKFAVLHWIKKKWVVWINGFYFFLKWIEFGVVFAFAQGVNIIVSVGGLYVISVFGLSTDDFDGEVYDITECCAGDDEN